jgi:hypothetical protein
VFNLGVNVRNAYEKVNIFGGRFSRPGQPERFEESSQASIGQTVLNKIEAALAAGKTVYLSNMMKSTVITPKNYAKWKASGTPLFKVDSKGDLRIYQGGKYVVLTSGAISHVRVDAHSRPGQPERFDMEGACWEGYEPVGTKQKDGKTVPNCVPMKNAEEDADTFDASSLERGAFAEASKSPMLGKLLAAKAMPDGGWRAVQVGSDTLVISFEDADLARDFGRRVASKGYSATSPVATTGRYWNVEVKNG